MPTPSHSLTRWFLAADSSHARLFEQHANEWQLIAPHRFLGELKSMMSAELERYVYATVHKDLTHHSDSKVREHVASELARRDAVRGHAP